MTASSALYTVKADEKNFKYILSHFFQSYIHLVSVVKERARNKIII